MRCVQIVATKGQGGLERHYVDLCHALASRGVEVTAIADPSFADRLQAAGVEHRPVEMEGSRWSPARLLRLAAMLKEIQPHVVHTHATKATSMIGSLRRLPLVGPRPWPPHVATIHGVKRNLRPYRDADRIIAVSARVAALVSSPNVRVVHNGLAYDPVEADRAYIEHAAQVDASRPVIVTAGRLVAVKGFDVLIAAMAGLDASLVIAGEGPEREALERQVQELGLGDRVRLLGHRGDVPHLFAAGDLGVVPSRYEGFCYVVVEMLQQRLPAVATDVADVAEFLGREHVVEPNRPDLLHQKLAEALNDPAALRARLSAAFEKAANELTLDHMTARTLDVYREATAAD